MIALAAEVMPDLPDDLARDWFGLATWFLIVVGIVICSWLLSNVRALKSDVVELKERVDDLETSLEREREGHEATRALLGDTQRLLTAALRHLRELWRWIHNGHNSEPPDIPEELRDEL